MENEKIFELMEKMYVELMGVKDEVKSVKSEMKEGFKKVNERLDAVEKTVIKIENDHGKKLDALFDGYKQNTEQLTRIENEVSKHEEVILRKVK